MYIYRYMIWACVLVSAPFDDLVVEGLDVVAGRALELVAELEIRVEHWACDLMGKGCQIKTFWR